jgi:hypothetical protein
MPGRGAGKVAFITGAARRQGSVLEHAAVLGAATGMRSTVALAALIVRRSDGLPAVLRHRRPAGSPRPPMARSWSPTSSPGRHHASTRPDLSAG